MHEIFTTMLSGLDELSIYTTKPMTRDDVPDVQPRTRVVKPLYILIKIDVDADIIRSQTDANTYCDNFCNKMQYEHVDYHYPIKYSERHYPYIAL